MSRFVKVITPNNGNGYYWEARTGTGRVVERGLAYTRDEAISQATLYSARYRSATSEVLDITDLTSVCLVDCVDYLA